eukprot:c11594_g1_i2.p1 GENE.c11594_g1_i2~~c11594_g1_i2.p1  ORF type:complete len:449 (+),score=91.23 c11594_g1_i2:1014-2360(+)
MQAQSNKGDQATPLLDTTSPFYASITPPRATSFVQGRRTSFFLSILNLTNGILGAGILGLPYACSRSGFILFSILLVAMGIVVDYSLSLLLQCCRFVNKFSYEELGLQAFGPRGPIIVGIAILVQNMGAMVSYLVVVGDLLPPVIKLAVGDDSDSPFARRQILMILAIFGVAFPIATLRQMALMSFASGLAFASIFVFTLVVIARYPTVDVCHHGQCAETSLGTFSSQTFMTLPTMCFSFVCHTTLLPVYAELETGDRVARTTRDQARMHLITRISILAAGTMYLIVANFGYATFHDSIEKDILISYQKWNSHDPLTLIVRVAFIAAVILTIPMLCFPFRKACLMMMFGTSDYHPKRFLIITICTLSLVLILALWVPAITTVFGLVGATSSVTLVFLLPSAIYLKLEATGSPSKLHRLLCKLMFAGGILICIVSISGMIANWVQHGFS